MGTRKALLESIAQHGFEQENWFMPLQDAVAGLTAEQAAWRPAPDVHNIWELVSHLTFWKQLVTERLNGAPPRGVQIDNEATFQAAESAAGWQDAVSHLLAAQTAFRKATSALSEEDLDQPEKHPHGINIADLIMHDAYHTGQIALLRKLQGAHPSQR